MWNNFTFHFLHALPLQTKKGYTKSVPRFFIMNRRGEKC